MTSTDAGLIAERVGAYLERLPAPVRAAAVQCGDREVGVRSSTWRPWLAGHGHPRPPRSFPRDLPSAASRAAVEALDGLPAATDAGGRWDRVVTRSHLAALSRTAVDDGSLVRAWVATMLWGSGTSNGRGPWRTSQGLAAAGLAACLEETQVAVRDGDVAGAHRRFQVPGCGEAFFTKWLWVAGLGGGGPVLPLVLDARVVSTLRLVHGRGWARPRGPEGYAGYVAAMHEAAEHLSVPGVRVTGEHLEWLLFRRSEGCLHAWLAGGRGIG